MADDLQLLNRARARARDRAVAGDGSLSLDPPKPIPDKDHELAATKQRFLNVYLAMKELGIDRVDERSLAQATKAVAEEAATLLRNEVEAARRVHDMINQPLKTVFFGARAVHKRVLPEVIEASKEIDERDVAEIERLFGTINDHLRPPDHDEALRSLPGGRAASTIKSVFETVRANILSSIKTLDIGSHELGLRQRSGRVDGLGPVGEEMNDVALTLAEMDPTPGADEPPARRVFATMSKKVEALKVLAYEMPLAMMNMEVLEDALSNRLTSIMDHPWLKNLGVDPYSASMMWKDPSPTAEAFLLAGTAYTILGGVSHTADMRGRENAFGNGRISLKQVLGLEKTQATRQEPQETEAILGSDGFYRDRPKEKKKNKRDRNDLPQTASEWHKWFERQPDSFAYRRYFDTATGADGRRRTVLQYLQNEHPKLIGEFYKTYDSPRQLSGPHPISMQNAVEFAARMEALAAVQPGSASGERNRDPQRDMAVDESTLTLSREFGTLRETAHRTSGQLTAIAGGAGAGSIIPRHLDPRIDILTRGF